LCCPDEKEHMQNSIEITKRYSGRKKKFGAEIEVG
jgi:hypothetical protein